MPNYDIDKLINELKSFLKSLKKLNVKIQIEAYHVEKAAPPTPQNHSSVVLLKESIKELRGFEPSVGE